MITIPYRKTTGWGGGIFLCNDPIRNYVVGGVTMGYTFNVEYGSYRGTWLSCIHDFKIWMDDVEVPAGNILFGINGKQFYIDQLPDMYKEFWGRLDKAEITVLQDGGIAPGEHKIHVMLESRNPYSAYLTPEFCVLEANDEGIRSVEA